MLAIGKYTHSNWQIIITFAPWLEDVDKTEEWLLEELQKQGYNGASEIFLAEYHNGEIWVVSWLVKEQKALRWLGKVQKKPIR